MIINQLMQHSGSKAVFDLEGSITAVGAQFIHVIWGDEKNYYFIRQNIIPRYHKWIKVRWLHTF
jgi:hypothetical protein